MGSITHWRPDKTGSPPNSSPRTSSSGHSVLNSPRRARSVSKSASDTGVISGFALTCSSEERNLFIVIASAASASRRARSTSSPYALLAHGNGVEVDEEVDELALPARSTCSIVSTTPSGPAIDQVTPRASTRRAVPPTPSTSAFPGSQSHDFTEC